MGQSEPVQAPANPNPVGTRPGYLKSTHFALTSGRLTHSRPCFPGLPLFSAATISDLPKRSPLLWKYNHCRGPVGTCPGPRESWPSRNPSRIFEVNSFCILRGPLSSTQSLSVPLRSHYLVLNWEDLDPPHLSSGVQQKATTARSWCQKPWRPRGARVETMHMFRAALLHVRISQPFNLK